MNPWWELDGDALHELGRRVNAVITSARFFTDLQTALNYSRWPEIITEFRGYYAAYQTA